MKNVVRETLQARTPAPGKDRPNGPVPSRIIAKQSATNIPLPHQTITLSMCCRTMEGHPWSAVGNGQGHRKMDGKRNSINFVCLPHRYYETRQKQWEQEFLYHARLTNSRYNLNRVGSVTPMKYCRAIR